ncbi:MAG TPA: ABC transporter ATP-binding protein [Paludibaculum sp.]|jgi:ABC-2 type transport system ATP-binding protein
MIQMQALTRNFGTLHALQGVNLEVPAGSVFAIVGPNGAGKTTALKLCVNLLRATTGRVTVMGVDSRRLGPSELARIGYMAESRQLPEWMSTGYFLSYCKEFYPNWSDDDAAELIRRFELPLDRPLKSLSRGMRMKAALAATLSYRPQLLLLDEPFSGLDVLVREQLIESILERTPEATVLLASHDLAEIESFATHIAYLDEGRIRFAEEMSTLTERFREIEVLLESPSDPPPSPPPGWLNLQQSGVTLRFTHARYDPDSTDGEIRRHYPALREITASPMPLRAIVYALAKSSGRTAA